MSNGGQVKLRQIELSDCTSKYVDWLNDPVVNKYLETKWTVQTLTSIESFVQGIREDNSSYLFAIEYIPEKIHIGNIKIGPVVPQHHSVNISYFIGEKRLWSRGIGTEAINLVLQFGFDDLGLHKIWAGTYESAVGSFRALENNGFIKEADFREQVLFEGEYISVYRYGLLDYEYKNARV